MTTRLKIATSGGPAWAADIGSNAAVSRVLKCVAGTSPLAPLDVEFSDLLPLLLAVSLSVPDFATLQALPNVGFGQKVRVESVGRSYEFAPLSTFVVDGAEVLAGIGGVWHSLNSTSDQKFQLQATWYVDGTAGTVEGDGSAAHPINSNLELARRLNGVIRTTMTVYIVSAPVGPTILTLSRQSISQSITFRSGAPVVVLATGPLATYAAPTAAGNAVTIISVTGVNFTNLVGKKVNFGAQGVARVAAANPGGLGVAFARITLPKIDNDQGTPATGVPVIGQTVTIEEWGPDLRNVAVLYTGVFGIAAAAPYFRPAVLFKGLQASENFTLGNADSVRWSNSQAYRVFDCDVVDESSGPQTAVFASSKRCQGKFTVESRNTACLFIALTAADNTAIYVREIPGGSAMFDCVCEKLTVNFYEAATNVVDLAVFDAPGDGIQVHNGASIYANGWLIGSGNTGAGITFDGLCSCVLSGAVLAITGAAGQIKTPNGGFITAADVPRQWDHGTVKDLQLVTGTRTATVPALPADACVTGIVRRIAAGGIGNTLTYSIAGNVITVTSSDNTETSTLELAWTSPSARTGGITA